ncbi:MAG TPA: DoxX family protein [Streptosporangiaceae bacterium]|nr:DoxX family protein [Streptosporangiaceae bacterium]
MSMLRALGRPLIASIFIIQGYETMRRPERVAKRAEPVVRSLAELADFLPDEPEEAVRLNGAVQFGAGMLLAAGWLPRLSALALAGSLVPTTMAGHRYWEEEDPQLRAQQRIHFLKNLSMLGGLLIAVTDNCDRPSLLPRLRHR